MLNQIINDVIFQVKYVNFDVMNVMNVIIIFLRICMLNPKIRVNYLS